MPVTTRANPTTPVAPSLDQAMDDDVTMLDAPLGNPISAPVTPVEELLLSPAPAPTPQLLPHQAHPASFLAPPPATQLHLHREILRHAAAPPPSNLPSSDRLSSKNSLAKVLTWLGLVEEEAEPTTKLWTAATESWLARQFTRDSPAHVTFNELVRSLPPVHRALAPDVVVKTRFENFSDFKNKIINKFYNQARLRQMILAYIEGLVIRPSDPLMASNYVNLAQKVERAFHLLPAGDPFTGEAGIVAHALKTLPPSTASPCEKAATQLGESLTTFSVLIRHLEALDQEFEARRSDPSHKRKTPPSSDSQSRPLAGSNVWQRPGYKDNHKHTTPTHDHSYKSHNSASPATKSNTYPATGYSRYQGKCDGCGQPGHSIMLCPTTSDDDKHAWRAKVAANKATRSLSKVSLNS